MKHGKVLSGAKRFHDATWLEPESGCIRRAKSTPAHATRFVRRPRPPGGSRVTLAHFALWLLVASLAAAFSAPAAAASASRPRFVAERFEGPGDEIVRQGIVQVLDESKKVHLLSVKEVENANLTTNGSTQSYAKMARTLNLSGIVSGEVRQTGKRRFVLTLVVRNGKDGEVLETMTYQSHWVYGLRDSAARGLKGRLNDIVARAEPPGGGSAATEDIEVTLDEEPYSEPDTPEERGPAETRDEDEKPKDDPAAAKDDISYTPIELGVGGTFVLRDYHYQGEIRGALRTYTLSGAGGYYTALKWYPAAHFTSSTISHFGIAFAYHHMLTAGSQVNEVELADAQDEYQLGAVARLPISQSQLGFGMYYGRHQFVVEDTFVPDVTYQFLGATLDGRLRLSWFVFEAGFGVRLPLGAGELTSPEWYPDATGFGLHAFGRLGYQVTPGFDVLAGLTWTRYQLVLNQPSNSMNLNGVAEGAVDNHMAVSIGLGFSLPPGK